MEWWDVAFSKNENQSIRQRFYVEAKGTLVVDPSQSSDYKNLKITLDQIFSALSLKRISLKSDQGIEEWDGVH